MIIKGAQIPKNSLLNRSGESFEYVDNFQSLICTKDLIVDKEIILQLFLSSGPKWSESLFVLRDKIVGLFGLKTTKQITKKDGQIEKFKFQIGEQLGIFKLFGQSDNEIILGEDDKHLNFRVSLMLEHVENEVSKTRLFITTAVKFNNFFGRVYFFPVKPIHRILVQSTLRNIIKQLEKR